MKGGATPFPFAISVIQIRYPSTAGCTLWLAQLSVPYSINSVLRITNRKLGISSMSEKTEAKIILRVLSYNTYGPNGP